MAAAQHRFPSLSKQWWSALFLLGLSVWSLTFASFSLFLRTPSRTLHSIDPINASISLRKEGYAGPLEILLPKEMEVVARIASEWEIFLPAMKAKLLAQGLIEPPERTCFMWLPECYTLAKNDRILEYVTKTIGPNVLLYGITTWQGTNKHLQRCHADQEFLRCEKTVNFVMATNIDLISQSHCILEWHFQSVLDKLRVTEDESLAISYLQGRAAFFDRVLLNIGSWMPHFCKLQLKSFDLASGYGVFLNGNIIYRINDVFGDTHTPGLLMQFMSAECVARDSWNYEWELQGMERAVYMPPVLLVAGDRLALNDVRLVIQSAGAVSLLESIWNVLGGSLGEQTAWNKGGSYGAPGGIVEEQSVWNEDRNHGASEGIAEEHSGWTKHNSHIENLTVFSQSFSGKTLEDMGIWRYFGLGHISTALVPWACIDQILLNRTLQFGRDMDDAEQIIIPLSEGMLYVVATSVNEYFHFQVLELKVGSAVTLSKNLLHALVPLGRESAFLSFRWIDNSKATHV